MVCRSTQGNSGLTSYVRLLTGVDDVQMLSLFHEQHRSAPNGARTPNRAEYVSYLRDMRARVEADQTLTERRRANIVARLERGESQAPDAANYYAWQTITERAVRARMALDAHFASIASAHNSTPEAVRAAFERLAHDNREAGAANADRPPALLAFDTANLPGDRATLYALSVLHQGGPAVATDADARARAYETAQAHASVAARRTQRRSETAARRGPHAEAVREAAEQEAQAGSQIRCANCGEFAAEGHVCAPTTEVDASPYAPPSAAEQRNLLQDAPEVASRIRRGETGGYYTSDNRSFASHARAMDYERRLMRSEAERNTTPAAPVQGTASEEFPLEDWEHLLLSTSRCETCGQWQTSDHECPRHPNGDLMTLAPQPVDALLRIHQADNGEWVTESGVSFPTQTEAMDYQRRELSPVSDAPLGLAEARDRVRHIGADYVTSDGRNFAQQQVAAIRHERSLPRGYEASPSPYTTSDYSLERHYGRGVSWDAFRMRWVTDGGEAYANRLDALVAERTAEEERNALADQQDADWHADRGYDAPETCEDCGQFMGPNHSCAAVHGDIDGYQAATQRRIDRQAARERAARDNGRRSRFPEADTELLGQINETLRSTDSQTTVTAEDLRSVTERASQDRAADRLAEQEATRERQRTATRTYRSPDGHSVRMMNLSQVRADVRALPVGEPLTLERISADIYDRETGTIETVTGSIAVTSTGRRRSSRNRADRLEVAPNGERALRCNCADYQANYDCVHVRQACEEVQARLNDREATAVAPAQVVAAVRSDLVAEYQDSLAAQQQARADFAATPSVSYAEDMAAFQGAWDEAKARLESGDHRLPYQTENATGGLGAREGGRSFGIEIEIDFPDDMTYEVKNTVAREIYEAGLSASPDVRPWHWSARQVDSRGRRMGGGYTDNPNAWAVEFDRSVDDVDGRRGCEIVSPIMYDTPETWENIAKITEIIERNGGRATPRTGLHVNVGAADYDHTVGNHNRLLHLSSAYEDVLVRVAHNPQSAPHHRGRAYCGPSEVPAEGYRRISHAQAGNSHRSMVNLDHVPAEGMPVTNSTRVEVRIFDGTTDKGRLQTNIKVALGLVNAATRGAEPGIDPEPAGTHRQANVGSNGRMRRLSGDDWTRDTTSFRKFADTIFSREEDKKQLVGAFAASRWQAR